MTAGARIQSCPSHSRGLAAVELAIVLPVFLMLMLGTAELGRVLYEYNTLTKSATGAVRYLAEHARTPAGQVEISSEAATVTRNLAVFGSPAGGAAPLLRGLSTGQVSVTQVDEDNVQVSISYAYIPLFAAIPTFGLRDGPLTVTGTLVATQTMRAL
jgi:Flp pilus assembly protein TadG